MSPCSDQHPKPQQPRQSYSLFLTCCGVTRLYSALQGPPGLGHRVWLGDAAVALKTSTQGGPRVVPPLQWLERGTWPILTRGNGESGGASFQDTRDLTAWHPCPVPLPPTSSRASLHLHWMSQPGCRVASREQPPLDVWVGTEASCPGCGGELPAHLSLGRLWLATWQQPQERPKPLLSS